MSLTKMYNDDWQKKLLSPDRCDSQRRVVCAFDKLFRMLNAPFAGNILDVGCGDGALVKVLRDNLECEGGGSKVQGIDVNDCNFETDKLPYSDNEFDVVIMYSVIEHLYNPNNILLEAKRTLKPNGHIIIITSNINTDKTNFYDDPTHVHPYNPTSIKHLLRLYGYEKVFVGLWTIPKTTFLWRLPEDLQFLIGKWLPFKGTNKLAMPFLKGRSKTMLCVFKVKK